MGRGKKIPGALSPADAGEMAAKRRRGSSVLQTLPLNEFLTLDTCPLRHQLHAQGPPAASGPTPSTLSQQATGTHVRVCVCARLHQASAKDSSWTPHPSGGSLTSSGVKASHALSSAPPTAHVLWATRVALSPEHSHGSFCLELPSPDHHPHPPSRLSSVPPPLRRLPLELAQLLLLSVRTDRGTWALLPGAHILIRDPPPPKC